jgi:hypothetical protein
MQKSKGKTERLPAGLVHAGRKSLFSRARSRRTQDADTTKRALLPFVFCILTFAFAFFLLPAVLNAQGCAMCYTSASAARSGAKEALANGVLILLIPPMVFFALFTVVIYIYRNKFREPASWQLEHDREFKELLADIAPPIEVRGPE